MFKSLIVLGYVLIALVPGVFWVWFYWRQDREKPEPPKLLAKVFFIGMAITLPAVAFEFAFDYFFSFSQTSSFPAVVAVAFLIVAPIEELLKYFVVREVVLKDPHFDEPVDGVIYAVVAALGFASLENILVVLGEGGSIIFLRFFTATLMHALTSGIVGYHLGLGLARPKERKSLLAQGLITAIILHALYNISVSLTENLAITLALLVILLGSMFIILARGIQELKQLDLKIKKS